MPVFPVLSMRRVSAAFLRVQASLSVAEVTYIGDKNSLSPLRYAWQRYERDGKPTASTLYTAYVRVRRGKAILHTEATTFSHRSAAVSWARHREIVLEDPS